MNVQRSPLALILALASCFVAVIAAYVVLALNGHASDTSSLVTAAIGLLGFLGLGAHFSTETSAQNTEIQTIKQQTNGVLDRRIKDGASAALAEFALTHGLPIPSLPGLVATAKADLAAVVADPAPAPVPGPEAPSNVVPLTPPTPSV